MEIGDRSGTRRGGLSGVSAAVLLLAATAVPSTAQVVEGRVTSSGGDAPIAGAIVHLVRASDGAVVFSALTERNGLFSVRGETAGAYRLRAELIGYETVETGPFKLAPGAVIRHDIRMPVRPIRLEAVVVPERTRCVLRPEEGARLADVWEEARKALTAAELTESEKQYRYVVERYERRVDARTGIVRTESRTARTTNAARPFRSLSPDVFQLRGWVHEDGEHLNYFAPDARALLSAEFLQSHCLRLVGTAGDTVIGIGFEPMDGRDVPEIAGTLWLDRRTSALRSLDFRYVNLHEGEWSSDVGGRVEFERLPEGAWIVRRWRVRMPLLARASANEWRGRMVPPSPRLIELKEDGGEVVAVRDRTGKAVAAGAGRATITGSVYDSTRMAPLGAARVSVTGTPYVTTTDERGRFALTGLSEGEYHVSFEHPRADSLILSRPTGAHVTLRGADTVVIELALPPEQGGLDALCAGEFADPDPPEGAVRGETTGTLVGRVRRGRAGRPVEGARVHLAWSRWGVEADAYRPLTTSVWEYPWRQVHETDPEGVFVSCRLPALVPILAWVENDGVAGDTARIYVPEGRFIQHDFKVESSGPTGHEPRPR